MTSPVSWRCVLLSTLFDSRWTHFRTHAAARCCRPIWSCCDVRLHTTRRYACTFTHSHTHTHTHPRIHTYLISGCFRTHAAAKSCSPFKRLHTTKRCTVSHITHAHAHTHLMSPPLRRARGIVLQVIIFEMLFLNFLPTGFEVVPSSADQRASLLDQEPVAAVRGRGIYMLFVCVCVFFIILV